MNKLRTRATRALKWSWLQAGLGSVLQLGIAAIVARLLAPKDFGVVALANVAVRFMTYFSQMGFGVAIVQRQTLDRRDVRELMTLSALAGTFFACVGLVVSLSLSSDVGAILRLLSLSFIVVGLSVVPYGILRRELRYRQLATIELLGQVIGAGIVTIALARSGAGPWSLAIGVVTQQIVVTLGVQAAVRSTATRVGFSLPTRSVLSYLRFGIAHSINTFLEFVLYNIEVTLIGAWFGVRQTGFYNRAFLISHLPVEQVMTSVVRVLFPVLSRLRGDREKETSAFLTTFLFGGVFAFGFCAAMFVASDQISSVMFGRGWEATVPLMRIFALVIPVRYLLNLQSAWLDARGALAVRTRIVGICVVVKAVGIGAAIYLRCSLSTVVLVGILPDFLWQVAYLWTVPQCTSLPIRKLLTCYAVFLVEAVAVGLVVHAVTSLALHEVAPRLLTLAIQIVAGGTTVAVAMFLAVRSRVVDIRGDLLSELPVIGRVLSARSQRT